MAPIMARRSVWLSAIFLGLTTLPVAEATSKVMLFCHESTASCQHMADSYRKLHTIWTGMGRFPSTAFAEVDCARDKAFCDKEGVSSFPTAVHYKNGFRAASWTTDRGEESQSSSMLQDMIAWINKEISTEPKSGND